MPITPSEEAWKAAEEAMKKARINKLRSAHNDTMKRLHSLPYSRSVSEEISLVTHEYAQSVAKILTN